MKRTVQIEKKRIMKVEKPKEMTRTVGEEDEQNITEKELDEGNI